MSSESVKRILVVDDEPDILDVLDRRLKANGYDVQAARNGQEALSRIRQSKPDLILLDVIMPVMDGFATYKELKRSNATANIPVIILTARSKMEDTFVAAGVDAFLVKPFDAPAMLAKVEELLKKQMGVPALKEQSVTTPEESVSEPRRKRPPLSQIIIYAFVGVFGIILVLVIFGLYYLSTHSGSTAATTGTP